LLSGEIDGRFEIQEIECYKLELEIKENEN
jgi:hypothetical protein